MSDHKNIDQEDISGNADFSTQSNESYHLSLALNTKEIEHEFSSNLIEGLRLQRRFKDVSYIKIKQNSVLLKASDTMSNQFVLIKAKKQQDLSNIDGDIKKLKDMTHNNQDLFVQIIDYWILIKDEYSLLFMEMEYLNQSLESYLNKKTINGQDITYDEKFSIVKQILQGVHQIEIQQLCFISFNISNYYMKEGSPKLLLCGFRQYQIEKKEHKDLNNPNNLKKCLVKLLCSTLNIQSNLLSAGIIGLIVANWLCFSDQIIKQIGVFTLADQIRKGEIGDLTQIDKSTVFYEQFKSLINTYSQQSEVKTIQTAQHYLDMLSKKNNLISDQKVELKSDTKKQKDIYDDDSDEEEEEEDEEQNMGIFNKNNNIKLQILNPSMIINKYLHSVQNCQQSTNSNRKEVNEENEAMNSREEGKQSEDYNIKNEDEQIKVEKFQKSQLSEMKKMNHEEKVVVLDDDNTTPAQSKLFASSDQHNHSKIIQFSNKKDNEEKIDISYNNNNNNDVVLEMKDVDVSVANSSRQQKNLENSNVAQNPYSNYKKFLLDLDVDCDDISEIFIMEYQEQTNCCLYSFSCVNPVIYIRLKLFCGVNPLLGKNLLDVIFMPFISIFNKPWTIKKNGNCGVLVLSHLFLWVLKILNIICMLILVSIYLCILFVILVLVHVIYFSSLLILGIVMIPTGLIRVFIRLYFKLSDFKSSLIYTRQSSFTWFEYDYQFQTAREFKTFCHKMMSRKYSYFQSPSHNYTNNNQILHD